MATTRKTRANGEESRRKIVEAALEIAAERGYDGTSISLVSERSGLPASSIYWHFADKDALIAAVIQHSFDRWLSLMGDAFEGESDAGTALTRSMKRVARSIVEAPDFLRLGLMLTLERRPEELTARTIFLHVRDRTRVESEVFYRKIFGDRLDDQGVATLALMAMAATDGLFVAREVDGDALDMERAFELIGVALNAVADHLGNERQQRETHRG